MLLPFGKVRTESFSQNLFVGGNKSCFKGRNSSQNGAKKPVSELNTKSKKPRPRGYS